MDGLGRLAGGFGQPLCRPAGGGGQHAFEFLGHEDFQDAADERGLADARPPRDHEHLLPAGLPDGLALALGQADGHFALHPGDGPFHVDLGHRVRRGGGDAADRSGQPGLGPVQRSQIQPVFALDELADDRLLLDGGADRLFHNQLVDFDQPGGVFDHAGLGISAMALAGQFLQRVLDGGPGPIGTVAVDAQPGGQLVGRLEADAPDVVGELVRVLLDLGDRLLAVGAVDADGPAGADAVLGQEEHDLADFLLLFPALPDPLHFPPPDAPDVLQEVGGRVEDFQRPFLVDADNLGRQLRADAADCPGGQIPLDARGRSRVRGPDLVGLELLAVGAIDHPLAGPFQVLAGRDRGGAAHDRHQFRAALDRDLEHGEAALRIVVGNPLDYAFEGFGHGKGDRVDCANGLRRAARRLCAYSISPWTGTPDKWREACYTGRMPRNLVICW